MSNHSSVHLPHRYFYPWRWGERVVTDFTERYARATELVAKLCGMSRVELKRHLIYLVCTDDQTAWEGAKRAIKALRYYSIEDFRSLDTPARRDYLTYVVQIQDSDPS